MKKCSCEWCERTEENWNGRFKRVDGILYCEKHYQQLKKKGYLNEEKDKIYGVGINDMPNGWISKNKDNTVHLIGNSKNKDHPLDVAIPLLDIYDNNGNKVSSMDDYEGM